MFSLSVNYVHGRFVYIGLKVKAKETSLPRWIHRESTLVFALSSDTDERKNCFQFDLLVWIGP